VETIEARHELLENGGEAAIEIVSGQCTVVQCNPGIGRLFIQSIMGERSPSRCRVDYRGEPLSLADPETAKRVGLCPLDEGLYERLKVREYLSFWAELYGVRRPVAELLGRFGLEGRVNDRIAKLSYSEKRLLGFARSLIHDPELILWEEPEQNLDLESCMIVRRAIAELTVRDNKAMLITCSTMEQSLSISSRIFRLTDRALTRLAIQEATEPSDFASSVTDEDEAIAAASKDLPDDAPRVTLPRLMVKTEDKYVFLDPRHICFVESNDGITHLYTKEGSFAGAWTLAELEDKLKPYRMYRCHRSYMVNLDHIAELIVWSRNSYSLVLSDDKRSRIPLSKGKFEELKAIVRL